MKKFIIAIVISIVLGGLLIWGISKVPVKDPSTITSREVALTCTTDMATQYHIHPELSILLNGVPQVLPSDIGIRPNCMNSIHTHDSTGKIHVEAPIKKDFTLGDFFASWKKDFSSTKILDSVVDGEHEIVVTVNGKKVDTYENTLLGDLDKIVVVYQKKLK
jgi:hypothetical protein